MTELGLVPDGMIYTYVYAFVTEGKADDVFVPTAIREIGAFIDRTVVIWYRPVEVNFMRPCAVTENKETNPVLCVKLWRGTWKA
jgi:hypothetical protein